MKAIPAKYTPAGALIPNPTETNPNFAIDQLAPSTVATKSAHRRGRRIFASNVEAPLVSTSYLVTAIG